MRETPSPFFACLAILSPFSITVSRSAGRSCPAPRRSPAYPVKNASAAKMRRMTSKNSPATTKKVLSAPCVARLRDPLLRRLSLRLLGVQRL
jgi:hypothetical protein